MWKQMKGVLERATTATNLLSNSSPSKRSKISQGFSTTVGANMLRSIGRRGRVGWRTSGVRCVISRSSRGVRILTQSQDTHTLHTSVAVSCSPSTTNATARTWMIGPSSSPRSITHYRGRPIQGMEYNMDHRAYVVVTTDQQIVMVTEETLQDAEYIRTVFR